MQGDVFCSGPARGWARQVGVQQLKKPASGRSKCTPAVATAICICPVGPLPSRPPPPLPEVGPLLAGERLPTRPAVVDNVLLQLVAEV